MSSQPDLGTWPPVQVSRHVMFYEDGLSANRPTPNIEDQASVFMNPGKKVAQLFPQALGS